MSNKLKKEYKNVHLVVNCTKGTDMIVMPSKVECVITNDKVGKTLSIIDNGKIITIPFEPLEKYLL